VLDHFPAWPKETDGVKEVHVNLPKRQVVVWANAKPEFSTKSKGESKDEAWEYMGEYIFWLTYNEVGKIVRIVEFLDSKNSMELLDLFQKARENIAKSG
jgi:hypothetical protein